MGLHSPSSTDRSDFRPGCNSSIGVPSDQSVGCLGIRVAYSNIRALDSAQGRYLLPRAVTRGREARALGARTFSYEG